MAGGREKKQINAFKVLKGTSHSNVHAAADIIDVESTGSCTPVDSALAADAEVTLSMILEDVGVSREDIETLIADNHIDPDSITLL